MDIHDLNHIRWRWRIQQFFRKMNWQNWMVTSIAVIGIASAAVWLVRDVQSVIDDYGPAQGSLIVNINTATEKELLTVPGIGPARAAQIIAGRPYENVDELEEISGFGGKTMESVRPFLTTERETRKR